MLSIDFETALIQPGLQAPPTVCISAASESDSCVVTDWYDLLSEALRYQELIIGLNTGYDLKVACAERPELLPLVFRAYDENRITDVSIRQKLIDIAMGEYRQHGGYGLAVLAKRLLGVHVEKEDTWRLRYWELKGIPIKYWPREAIEYPKTDAEIPKNIYWAQEKDLAEVDRLCVLEDQYRQCRADFALQLVSAWGLRTDRYGVARLRKECEDELAQLEVDLLAAGLLRKVKKKGVITIAKSIRAAQARMFAHDPNARLTKTGQKKGLREIKYISVDAEACKDSGDPVLEKYSRYSQVGSLLNGHVKAVEEGIEKPIHTRFEVLLETGRTSSSGPNVQNMRTTKGARECFVPRPGWVYIACDFDKAELHTLAQVCINLVGRSVLADVLNAGRDPHIELGAKLAGCSYDDLKTRVKNKDSVAKDLRQRAKPGNFGFPGGMGPKGMIRYAKGYGLILTLEAAEGLYCGWQEAYPHVAYDYLGWIRNMTAATGYATIEHHGSKRWRGKVPYCAAANSFFQGMSADAMKAALWEVIKKCYTKGTALFGCRVVNEMHDEFLVEAPLATASDAAWELQSTMVAAYNTYTPDVPVSATPALMDRWSKGADTIVKDGQLQVWRYAA